MRQQVDFEFRVFRYSPASPETSSPANSEYIRREYLAKGWEILNTEIAQVSSGEVMLGISFVKYILVAEKPPVEIKRGPGRPAKANEDSVPA